MPTYRRRTVKRDQRDANEHEIVRELQDAGAFVLQLSEAGLPDLLCSLYGLLFLVEVKNGQRGTLTPAQVQFFEDVMPEHQLPAYIADHIDDVPTILQRVAQHYSEGEQCTRLRYFAQKHTPAEA